jgi:nicotinamidase-related amidase
MSKDPVLVVVDTQQGFRDENYWGKSANPDCLANIEALTEFFRQQSWPIVVVKHNSKNPDSPLHSGAEGNQLEPFLSGPRDAVIQKSVNSAFYGTPDLHLWLSKRDYRRVVICGITTNLCCETTARMAGNLGYQVDFIIDATNAFDRRDLDGGLIPAAQVMQMTAANLHGEFAQVMTTSEWLEKAK